MKIYTEEFQNNHEKRLGSNVWVLYEMQHCAEKS